MPLYEYRCNACGAIFEKMTRWSESGRSPSCPACSSLDTQKKISTFASTGSPAATGGGASSSCGPSARFS